MCIHNLLLQFFSQVYDLDSNTTYLVCVNFFHTWRQLQFKVNCKLESFEKLFHGNFIFAPTVFTRNLLRRIREEIVFHISFHFRCLSWGFELWIHICTKVIAVTLLWSIKRVRRAKYTAASTPQLNRKEQHDKPQYTCGIIIISINVIICRILQCSHVCKRLFCVEFIKNVKFCMTLVNNSVWIWSMTWVIFI